MSNYQIHISAGIHPAPLPYEISAAIILADFFQTDIHLNPRNANIKTADFIINGTAWELKSPTGNSKRTIQNNLRKADHQSPNIILDLRRCKMPTAQAISRANFELSQANAIKKLILIVHNKKVVVIK